MVKESALAAFRESLRGLLIQAGEPGYDESRSVWNGMVDRRPRLIARCSGATDIIRSVCFARDHDLLVSVKGGGHGVAGKSVCDDGLMIDLSGMKSVRVDVRTRTVRVGPGATLGDVDHETAAFSLAAPGGIVSHTGVAGLTLGGGIGYLSRKYGLTIDNLVSADVVTANGELLQANESENSDLFWGLRGGGGNFGIVSSFEFTLHEIGQEVATAQVFYPFEAAEKVLHAYRELTANAPEELAVYALAVNVPPVAPFPEKFHGKTALAIIACYCGTIGDGMAILSPLREWGRPILDVVAPMPFSSFQKSFDQGVPSGGRYYWKGHSFGSISDDAIRTFVTRAASLPGAYSLVGFEPLGGAISRVDPAATAFSERNADYELGIWIGWPDAADDVDNISWAREFYAAMTPHANGGVYSNYLDRDDDQRVEAAFGPNMDRLRTVKAKYDPDNFFRLNQNILPAT